MALLVLSGPPGVGKSTVARELARRTGLRRAVAHTTRKPRPGEAEGADYRFVAAEAFERLRPGLVAVDTVLGEHYGMLPGELDGDCVAVLSRAGWEAVRGRPAALGAYLRAPRPEELRRRLHRRHRGPAGPREADRLLRGRLNPEEERTAEGLYDHCLEVASAGQAAAHLEGLLRAWRMRGRPAGGPAAAG